MATRLVTVLLCVLLVGPVLSADAEELVVLDLSKESFENWESKSFEGETDYRLLEQGDGPFILADSKGAASGLFLKQGIDIEKYPIIEWHWRVDEGIAAHDEQRKEGDDYAARLYVVVDGGFFFWKTIAMNYVWSSNPASETPWSNAYAGDNAQMLALRGGEDEKGKWYTERRNLREDFRRLFDRDIAEIDAVAIMTDTDDMEVAARARYGRITFRTE